MGVGAGAEGLGVLSTWLENKTLIAQLVAKDVGHHEAARFGDMDLPIFEFLCPLDDHFGMREKVPTALQHKAAADFFDGEVDVFWCAL